MLIDAPTTFLPARSETAPPDPVGVTPSPRRRRLGAMAGLLAATLAVAACGGGSTGVAAGGGSTETSLAATAPSTAASSPVPSSADPAPPAPRSSSGALPGLTVNDVGAGTRIDLASVATTQRPLLVWFWAPH